ncbi:amine oxidase [Opisthorchis viverrini]|uniref:Amine oxidase n=1 Tax=Opisthorchis viverrini TaxID=6198 RepID=A0A1S8WX04_OPIVI|nr:amine oxidase [Opisthorchis viverrini]
MYDVVIIGAGIAGLGAARVLTREAYNVIVLEARSRPGGRIHTVQLPSLYTDGAPCPRPRSYSNETLRFSHAVNHDQLSVFHTGRIDRSSPHSDSTNENRNCNTLPADVDSNDPNQSQPICAHFCDENDDSSGPLDVDLGANYLIGCANRQTDQPLFHMARLLGVSTATCVGDLCKKYRGWECAELAVWRDHNQPDAPIIPLQEVAEAAFLFDKVVHLAVDKHLKFRNRASLSTAAVGPGSNHAYAAGEPSVKVSEVQVHCGHPRYQLFALKNMRTQLMLPPHIEIAVQLIDDSLQSILQSEANFGLRPAPTFRNEVEAGIFQSILLRYLAYVNPIDRLPHTVLDELCEVATPRWHLSMSGTTALQSLGLQELSVRKLTLSDRLALAYPSDEQREAYQIWAERKLQALANGQAGSRPSVARAVNVSWEDRLVTGRFSDLIQPLIENVPIVYNAVVTDVDWSGDSICGVRVRAVVSREDGESSNGDSNRQTDKTEPVMQFYDAKHCIITVPVGVLKGLDPRSVIHFKPELPPEKRQAINRLGPPFLGAPTHDKVILRFRVPEDVFWDTRAAHLKCPDPRLHILNLHRYGKPGVLCCHIWGGSGLCPTGHRDQEVVDVILDLLDRMYPTTPNDGKTSRRIPEPMFYLVTRWSEDPFALGAYTTGEPGSTDEDRRLYATSLTSADARRMCGLDMSTVGTPTSDVPRLLFAGEGTLTASEAKECTHGALQTGVLRALELFPFLERKSVNAYYNEKTNRLPCTLNGSQLRTIILGKLAHYLTGKPLARWISTLNNYRPHRVVRPTRSFRDLLMNGVRKKQDGQLNFPAMEVSNPVNPNLSHIAASEPNGPVGDNLQQARGRTLRAIGRGRSNCARTSTLSRRRAGTRRGYGYTRKRRSGTNRTNTSYSSVDSQSETSVSTIEARVHLGHHGLMQLKSTILSSFSTALVEIRHLWSTLTSQDRQYALSELSGLLNELRVMHSELEDRESLRVSPVLMMPSDNPIVPFPSSR